MKTTVFARFVAFAAIALALIFGLGLRTSHAAPPANSVIGNQAVATYTDPTGVSRTSTSNLVQTTVAQVGSYTLTSTQTKYVAPGGTVYFPHTLTNTGNGADTFTLSATDADTGTIAFPTLVMYADANGDGIPDNSTTITSTGSVPANGVFKFVVAASVPGNQAGATTDTITVTGGTGGFGATPVNNTDTVNVSANAVINVVKSMSQTQGASPNAGPITVTLTYTNTGAAPASAVTITDVIGAGATAGMTYIPTATGGTQALWSGSATELTDAAAGDPAGITYDYNITTGNTVTAVIASVAPGASGTVSFQISINASLPAGSATTTNTARFSYNDNVAPIAATDTNVVPYVVNPGYGVIASDTGSTTDGDAANDFVHVASAAQGSTVSFDNRVQNNGTVTDTFNMTIANVDFPAGTTFQFYNASNSAPLTDTNGDGIPDTGPVTAGSTVSVFVRATLPPNGTTSAAVTATVTATSVGNGSTDTVTDRLADIVEKVIDLRNSPTFGLAGTGFQATGEAAAQYTPAAVNPGASVTYPIRVTNSTGSADNYNLILRQNNTNINQAATTENSLPAGWTVVFRQDTSGGNDCSSLGGTVTNTGNIAAGGTSFFCAVITTPSNAASGTQDLYFRAASPSSAQYTAPTAAFDVLHNAVTVNAVSNLTLQPFKSSTVFPGGNTVYTHQMCNNGNTNIAAGTIQLSFANNQSAAGWTSALFVDTNGNNTIEIGTDTAIASLGFYAPVLAAGTCVTLLDNVFAPLGATSGQFNITTITANGGAAGTPSVTDTTTVVTGDVQITKEHQTQNCTTGVVATAFTSQPITSVAPGTCVQYRVTVRNVGSANVTNVVLSDATPQYTLLNTTHASCAVGGAGGDVSIAPVTNPGAGVAGAVTGTAVTLAPLQSAQLTYCVQIAP
jgi:uncharacterized repeat protein (TIGR01451 family)